MRCDTVTKTSYDTEVVKLQAVYGNSEENKSYSIATPTASVEITISNPAAFGEFEPKSEYYVDFASAADEKPSIEEHADMLYSVYCDAVGGVAFNGDPLPAWADFAADPNKQKQADAWRSVAKQSLQHTTR